MKFTDLLDAETGARVRAVLAVALAIVTGLITFLQLVADTLNTLPSWGHVGGVSMGIVGFITFLGRFTKLGNKP